MKKVKILLLDDSQAMVKHISGLLLGSGREVVTALNVDQALEGYQRHKPDAILADFILEGGHSGLEFVTAVFAAAKEKRPPAAILTVGALSAADEQKAKSIGVAIFQKPTRGKEEDFLQSVGIWLNAANLRS